MSDTPKTNEFLGLIAEAGPEHYGVLNVDDPWPDYRKLVDFARILERENAALREADQRGAAARELPAANSARCDEGNPSSAGTPSLLTSAKQPAQSAPHPDMVLVPRKTMRLIRLAFLPANPNRMRAADPDVVAAAREFVALAAAEEARNAT